MTQVKRKNVVRGTTQMPSLDVFYDTIKKKQMSLVAKNPIC